MAVVVVCMVIKINKQTWLEIRIFPSGERKRCRETESIKFYNSICVLLSLTSSVCIGKCKRVTVFVNESSSHNTQWVDECMHNKKIFVIFFFFLIVVVVFIVVAYTKSVIFLYLAFPLCSLFIRDSVLVTSLILSVLFIMQMLDGDFFLIFDVFFCKADAIDILMYMIMCFLLSILRKIQSLLILTSLLHFVWLLIGWGWFLWWDF